MTEEPGISREIKPSNEIQDEQGFEQVDSREVMEGVALNRQSYQTAHRIVYGLNIRKILEELKTDKKLNGALYEVEDLVGNVATFVSDSTSHTGIRQTTIPVVGVVVRDRSGNKFGAAGTFFGLVGSPVSLECQTGEVVNVNIFDRMCFGQELNYASEKEKIGEWVRDARKNAMPLSGVSLGNQPGSPADIIYEPMFDKKETTMTYLSWQQKEFLGNKASINAAKTMMKASVTERVLQK